MRILLFFVCLFAFSNFANAQIGNFSGNNSSFGYYGDNSTGVSSFGNKDQPSWKRRTEEEKLNPMQGVKDRLSNDAIDMIFSSTKAKCFNVDRKSNQYKGQIISGYKLTGTCGELEGEPLRAFIRNIFSKEENINFKEQLRCALRPSVLIRFEKGYDNTDVIISSPCYMAQIFYAGKTVEFNLTPAISWVKAFTAKAEENISKIATAPDDNSQSDSDTEGNVESPESTGLEGWQNNKKNQRKGWVTKSFGFSVPEKQEEAVKTQEPVKNEAVKKVTPLVSPDRNKKKSKIKKAWD